MPDPRDPRDPRDERGDHEQTADERAWQEIVDNYGERAEVDDLPGEAPSAEAPFGGRFGDPRAFVVDDADDPYVGRDPDDADDVVEEAADVDEGYVPPPPPPLPRLAPDRAVAWAGIFGSPAVLLVALILGIDLPSWLGYLLIGGFVGGFVYLVLRMPREPRDPWDDGAQV
ncbi:hypothetical protein [Nocardioides sp. YIM 152315]|uniref:hypothetical protein n=1 Tax=Nocardioides sp. YIM 152315 TaxID=3031760 RepID=UPI0023DBF122|nr:hypothetical protein [Nocardioides sp. YIM 152315]MDF1603028.1 hypothetical protein [Nocardioides sp. YIM 152315]